MTNNVLQNAYLQHLKLCYPDFAKEMQWPIPHKPLPAVDGVPLGDELVNSQEVVYPNCEFNYLKEIKRRDTYH